MANLDKGSDIVLSTRKDYKPITTNLDAAIGQEKRIGYAKQKDKATAKAAQLKLLAGINAGGLPKTLSDEVQAEMDKALQEVEAGTLDPESVAYARRLGDIGNMYNTHKEGWTNMGTQTAAVLKDPEGYVVMTDDGNGNYSDGKEKYLGAVEGGFYKGDKEGLTGSEMLATGIDAAKGIMKVDADFPKTIVTDIKTRLPSLVGTKIGDITVSKDTPYENIITAIKGLDPKSEQYEKLINNMTTAYGKDAAAYLLSISDGKSVTQDQVKDFLKGFIPSPVSTQTVKTNQEQLEADRVKRMNMALENAKKLADYKKKQEETYPNRQFTKASKVDIGGEEYDSGISTPVDFTEENLTLSSGEIRDAGTNELIDASTITLGGGEVHILNESTGNATPVFIGKAEVIDADGNKVIKRVIVPARLITKGKDVGLINGFREQANAINQASIEAGTLSADDIPTYQPNQPLGGAQSSTGTVDDLP